MGIASANSTKHVSAQDTKTADIKVYKRRIWMLALFSSLSMLIGMLFPLYSIMSNVNICFYGVTQEAINWTAQIFMVVYIVLVFPVASLIDFMDLRWTVLCAALFNTAAAATQFATLGPDGFTFVMVSSFLSSLGNIFILGIPPFLAAKWFPANELSRACAFGVFGNQFGVAVGFIFGPLLISSDCDQLDLISAGKRNVAYAVTAANFLILILVTFTFQNAPKVPPSASQVEKRGEQTVPYTKVVISMARNFNFGLIFIVYGLIVGSYFALATILNDLILRFLPHTEVYIGWMGFTFIVAGLIGSVIGGYVLDYTKKFKETTMVMCIGSFLSLILFSCLLLVQVLWVQFLTLFIFGFFLTGFLPIGFEYGLEMTYPLSESVCACLLNTSTMIFGLVLTEIFSRLLDNLGTIYFNAAFAITLFISCIITSFISRDYKRSKKEAQLKTIVN